MLTVSDGVTGGEDAVSTAVVCADGVGDRFEGICWTVGKFEADRRSGGADSDSVDSGDKVCGDGVEGDADFVVDNASIGTTEIRDSVAFALSKSADWEEGVRGIISGWPDCGVGFTEGYDIE